jgi:RHS repeat-associated protein
VIASATLTAQTRQVTASPVTVAVRTVNPGTSIDRGECLTVSAGDGAAYECGDLRLVHALPTTTTMNVARTPTLLYNSRHAQPGALIGADVKFDATITPTRLDVAVKVWKTASVSATVTRTFTWTGTWQANEFRRVVVPIKAGSSDLNLATGAYKYEFEVKAMSGSTTLGTATDVDTVVVVNRELSSFGEGWWIAGLEQIVQVGSQWLWIGGDGTTRLYKPLTSDVYMVTPSVDRPDTLLRVIRSGVTYWQRRLRGGAYVEFDNSGSHLSTVNRLGHTTTFGYTTFNSSYTVLDNITLPVPSGERKYTMSYVADGGGRPILTTVTAPANASETRAVAVGVASGTRRVNKIADPHATSETERWVGFRYDATSGRVLARRNRRNDSTFFAYDTASKTLAQVTVDLSRTNSSLGRSDPNSTWTFCPAEAASIATCNANPQPLALVTTKLDGPRTDVTDITTFMLNRWGAPDTVTGPLAHRARVHRSDSRFPMLATALVQPNGHVDSTTYTGRALTDRSISVNPFDEGNPARHAITQYTWHPSCDAVVKIVRPEGGSDSLTYNASNCNRIEQQDGRGDSTEVDFAYFSSGGKAGLLQSVTAADGATQTIDYDTYGNLELTKSPKNEYVRYSRDAIGRSVATRAYLTAGVNTGTLAQLDSVGYDMAGRDTLHYSFGPIVNSTYTNFTQQAWVRTSFDEEDNTLSVTRLGSPNSVLSSGGITTSWLYDAAGRRVRETSPDNAQENTDYDAAGNVIRVKPRHTASGQTIDLTYDALNRLTMRITPQMVIAAETVAVNQPFASAIFPKYAPSGLTIPRDTALFTYRDATGDMVTAWNRDARISRQYFTSGLLQGETQQIRTYNTGASNDFDQHVYSLSYTYDLEGRRKSLATRDGFGVTYSYQPQTGALETVYNGSTFGFQYDKTGALRLATGPNGVTEALTYDADGQLATRLQQGSSYNGIPGRNGIIHDEVLTYDARGKVLTATTELETSTFSYSGLGHLDFSERQRSMTFGSVEEHFETDPLGHLKKSGSLAFQTYTTYTHASTTGRLTSTSLPSQSATVLDYDEAGNTKHEHVRQFVDGSTGAVLLDVLSRFYYGADGKLRVADRRTGNPQSYIQAGVSPFVLDSYEEYRYDALGRRVLRRSRRDHACAPNFCPSVIERFVWDGNQLLTEIRYPGHNGISADSLEYDVGFVVQSRIPSGPPADPNLTFTDLYSKQYGRVNYTYGLALDRPLSIRREFFGRDSTQFSSFEVFPHYTWKGEPAGHTSTSGTGPEVTDVDWPVQGARAYGELFKMTPKGWFGSQILDSREESGLQYMRNRYYNPTTGRFTQEDPIGLAGGLNLYGFADGDPVNFDDPFGLCIPACLIPIAAQTGLVVAGSAQATALTAAAGVAVGAAGVNAGIAVIESVASPHGIANLVEGAFSIIDWRGYPGGKPPSGPFRLLQGQEYEKARGAANSANRAIHRLQESLKGLDIHEIHPVKFGGSPTDPANKVGLTRKQHAQFTAWWNQLMKDIQPQKE